MYTYTNVHILYATIVILHSCIHLQLQCNKCIETNNIIIAVAFSTQCQSLLPLLLQYDTDIELLAFNITCYMYSRHLEYSQLNQSLDINNDTVNRDTIANHSGLNQIMTKKMMNLSCNYWVSQIDVHTHA